MSPYDIPHYPTVGTVLATYGLNSFMLQTAADVIVGNAQAQGIMPVELPENFEVSSSGKVPMRPIPAHSLDPRLRER